VNFCSQCGHALLRQVPAGDDRERDTCPACGVVHYENPRTVVGCLVEHGDQILLCRRAIEPSRGLWTPPAGFLELDEGIVEGARRETREEACAEVDVLAPHAFIDLPHIGQSYALFRARLRIRDGFRPGVESLETQLFDAGALPWDELAFPVMHVALRLWSDDRRDGRTHVHAGELRWSGQGSRFDWRQYELVRHLRVPLERDGSGPPPPT